MKRVTLILGVAVAFVLTARATISEPDNVVYGTITFGGTQVTAANTNVTIEARAELNGPAIASYRMGDRQSVGDFYSLRVSLESLTPVSNPAAAAAGQTVYLVVQDDSGVRAQASYQVGARGQITRLDLAGALPGQTTHPADNNPDDNTISINEVVAYTLAWRAGTAWPSGPAKVPLDYAVRAGALWRSGEGYRLDSTASSAPAWWVSTNGISGVVSANPNSAVRSLPGGYPPGTAFTVTVDVTPPAGVGAYAVEDQPPAGWMVSNISDSGAFDAVNGKVKWGLFFDQTARRLTYSVTPAANSGMATFAGEASFDGTATVLIGGQYTVGSSSLVQVGLRPLGGNNGFNLSLSGSPNQSLIIQTSTNLKTWDPFTNLTLDGSGILDFVIPKGTGEKVFYRAKFNQ